MPSYFYHLKFELYPYADPTSSTSDQSPDHKSGNGAVKTVWLPPPGADLFTAHLPRHEPADSSPRLVRHKSGRWSSGVERGGGSRQVSDNSTASRGSGGSVIDCGPSRASGADEFTKILSAPKVNTTDTVGDPHKAIKDWRFGPVRVESVDSVDMGPVRSKHRRGESSMAHNSTNDGLAATSGRVTKARYESLEGKNTELGWGIVHLYRDGEETPGLGSGVELYSASSVKDDAASGSHTEGNATAGLGSQTNGKADGEDCTILCILAVPSYLTPSDFLGFVGEKTREEVSHFRMVMTGRMNRYLVLMKFKDGRVAKRWRKEWDGKVFTSMEPETCHVAFIKSITFQTPTSRQSNTSFPELTHDPFTPAASSSSAAASFLKPFPPPTPSLIELPTCPVCLERMDDSTGLLTIPCQHVFHCACLQKWRGSGCPVCRHTNPSLALSSLDPGNTSSYPSDPANPPFGSGEASLCSVCDCADDLWICLICGNVGCGRYKGGHAKEHWKDSAHNFALEIATQYVWDYADDMWVHRLIRNKGDGKVVELPSSTERGRGGGVEDMDMVPRQKLEGIGMEYTHLLTSQLESQRVYFEDLVSKAVSKASAASTAASLATIRADEAVSKLNELQIDHKRLRNEIIPSLEKDLAREKKRAERSSEIARGMSKSLMDEKKVSEGLMERIGHVNKSMIEMSKELSAVKAENADLKEQNRDLLFSITASDKIKTLEGEEGGAGLEKGELEGGTLSLPSEKKGRNKGKGKTGGK